MSSFTSTLFAPPAGGGAGLTESTSLAGLSSLRLGVAAAGYSSPRSGPSSSPPAPGSAGGYASAGPLGAHRSVPSMAGGAGGGGSALSKHSKGLKSAPVVLELGEAWVRAGFAGEIAPRHILSTRRLLASLRPQMAAPAAWLDDTPHGLSPRQLRDASLELSHSRLFLVNPWHRPAHWHPLLASLLRHVYFHVLHVNPRDRRLLLVEAIGWPQGFKQSLARAVHDLEVPGLALVRGIEAALYTSMPVVRPMPLAAAAAAGESYPGGSGGGFAPLVSSPSTALLLDIGWGETRMLPVYMGVPLHHLLVCVPLGMWDVHRKLAALLRPLLRMEYAQLGGDVDGAYFLEEESKLLSSHSLDRLLSTMSYVQPFQLAQEAFNTERHELIMASPSKQTGAGAAKAARGGSGGAGGAGPQPEQIALPPPLPPIPSSTAAMDLPAPLPFPFFLHASPPAGTPLPGFSPAAAATAAGAAAPSDLPVPLPAMISLPAVVRYDAFETLFEFDRCAASQAAIDRTQEVCTVPSEHAQLDVGNARASNAEQGLAATLVDLLVGDLGSRGSAGSSALRAGLLSNVVLQGGGGMVAGLAERLTDEANWMLGGGHVPGRGGRARAERVVGKGMQALQNRIVLNGCSSAVSAAPLPPLPPTSSSSSASTGAATATAPSLPPAPGPTPGSAPVPPPPSPFPFPSNCLGWTGSSIVGACDLLDEEWLSRAELAAFATGMGRAVSQEHVRARREAVDKAKRAAKKGNEGGATATQEGAAAGADAGTDAKADAATASDKKEGKDAPDEKQPAAAGPLTQLNPVAFPDWSHPDSTVALAHARTAAAHAAAVAAGGGVAGLHLHHGHGHGHHHTSSMAMGMAGGGSTLAALGLHRHTASSALLTLPSTTALTGSAAGPAPAP